MTSSEFEDSLRRSLVIDKLRAALTDWMSVPDDEVAQEYKRRNEKVKLEVVELHGGQVPRQGRGDGRRHRVVLRRAQGRYPDPREAGKSGTCWSTSTRSARRSTVPPSATSSAPTTTTSSMYTTPEQVRASHILFKTEGKRTRRPRRSPRTVLKEAKGGADFAELAKKYSEDEATAKQGRRPRLFQRRARWCRSSTRWRSAMEPGAISDLGEDPVRLSHHQAGRTRSRARRSARGGRRRSPIGSPTSGRRRVRRRWRRRSEKQLVEAGRSRPRGALSRG